MTAFQDMEKRLMDKIEKIENNRGYERGLHAMEEMGRNIMRQMEQVFKRITDGGQERG